MLTGKIINTINTVAKDRNCYTYKASASASQSKIMIVRRTTQARCQFCCEPANASCAAPDDLQLVSSQVWLSAIVRKVYRLQCNGAPQRARAACLIHGARVVYRRVWHHVCHVTADQHGRSRLTS